MPAKFNADEIFTIAINIEKNGEKFYRRASELAPEGEAKDLLNDLADWEKTHIRMFGELYDELKGITDRDLAWDPYGQAELYLQAISDGEVFCFNEQSVRFAEEAKSAKEILQFALDREKDAVIFYTSIEKVIPDDMVGDKIDAIVKEEISHVRLINERLAKLS